MDTVTHALVGAAISDCRLRRRLGPVATPFALAAASLPDADMALRFISSESILLHHRGITHSFLFILLAAPLLGLAGRALSRQGGWREWGILALLCLFSHTALDLLTSWGTMPLLPFSDARLSWDILPIIDLFLLAVTGASLVLNRLLRWERVDTFINPLVYPVVHRHPGRRKTADWAAKIALALAFLYILVGVQQNRQAVRTATETLRRSGVEPVEVRALPILLTYIACDIAAREANGTVHNALYSSYAPAELRFFAHPTLSAAEAGEELSSPAGCFFAWFTQGMFTADREEEGGVILRDRRFFGVRDPSASRFSLRFFYDDQGRPAGAARERGGPGLGNLRDELPSLWRLTWRGADGVETRD